MRVAIVGTGYVGLVTGACLARVGHRVRCVDLLPERVDRINAGEAPFYEPGLAELLESVVGSGALSATTDLEAAVAESEVTFIAVGTPSEDGEIDLSAVRGAAEQIGRCLRERSDYHVVVTKSTVVPGTSEGVVREVLERESGRQVGAFGLCMNPEFLREGSAVRDFMEPDRIVIGRCDERAGKVVARLYEAFDCPKLFTTPTNAEMIKYAANALLALLISYSNEVAELCESTPGTEATSVLEGVHLDRRWSPVVDGQRVKPDILSFLAAGVGFGGSCFPKDVSALRAYARSRGRGGRLLDATLEINAARAEHVVSLLEDAVGELEGASVAVLGLAFKPGTDDVRESPAFRIIDAVLERGAKVRAYDPMALESARPMIGSKVELCEEPEGVFAEADAAVLVTCWPEFRAWDWETLAATMRRKILLDGRNALADHSLPDDLVYVPIGKAVEKQDVSSVAAS